MTIDVQPGPAILLQIRGAPGQLYTLQVSTNLVNWLNLTNFPAAADGHWSITDTGVTNYPARFYRLTHP